MMVVDNASTGITLSVVRHTRFVGSERIQNIGIARNIVIIRKPDQGLLESRALFGI